MPRSAALFESPDTLALDWKGVYQEHAPRLRRIAERRVGTEQADDVVQDTFMRAFRNRSSLDPSRPIGAWLSSITLCSSTDALRRRSARPESPVDDEHAPGAPTESVEDEFDNMVRRVGIERAFDSLNQRQRRVLQRLELDGWTQEEVAAVEHLSTEAVKSLAARARRTFREAYAAFAENMGVFGGAALGPAAWRLRARLQRVHAFAGEHVGAFGMAAATVTVVAIATVPSVRPYASKAVENGSSHHVPEVGPAASDESRPSLEQAVARDAPAEGGRPAAATAPPTAPTATTAIGGDVHVDAAATVGRSGNEGSLALESTQQAPNVNGRTYAGVTVDDCDATTSTRVKCAAIDLLADPTP